MFRFRFPRRRRPADPEIDEELQYHLEMLSRERAESGAAPEDAQAFARRRLGNRTSIQEVTRETWRSGFKDAAAREVRHAVRMLRRAPAFYLLVIMILALGIAAAVSVFSLADGVLLCGERLAFDLLMSSKAVATRPWLLSCHWEMARGWGMSHAASTNRQI